MKHQSLFAETADRLKKPRPKLLDKRDAKAKVATKDRAENEKVRKRSEGHCEVWVATEPIFMFDATTMKSVEPRRVVVRCRHRAIGEPHHLISGIGRRNVGKSILAAHKIAVCRKCHQEIHGHVLKPLCDSERYDAATVRYERCR